MGEIVFGCGIWVRDAKSRRLGGVSGGKAKAVSELLLGQCSEIVNVMGRGWRVRIWGRGAAAARGCVAAGVGLGSLGSVSAMAGETEAADMCNVISRRLRSDCKGS